MDSEVLCCVVVKRRLQMLQEGATEEAIWLLSENPASGRIFEA